VKEDKGVEPHTERSSDNSRPSPKKRRDEMRQLAETYGVAPGEIGFAYLHGTVNCRLCEQSGEVSFTRRANYLNQAMTVELAEMDKTSGTKTECPQCNGTGFVALNIKEQLFVWKELMAYAYPKLSSVDIDKDKDTGRPRVIRYGHDRQMEERIKTEPKVSLKDRMRRQLELIRQVEEAEHRGD